MKSEAFMDKVRVGPNMVVTVLPNGPWSMGRNLSLWFAYLVVIGIFAAYIAGRALPPNPENGKILQFAGASSFIGYAAALWQMSIWYRRSWSMTIKATIDGLIYSLITGGIFCLLWPQ